MMSDEYVTVTATVKAKTAKAVLLDVGDEVSRGAWIPRSCLHAASDAKVQDANIGDELELQVREWIAEREDLI